MRWSRAASDSSSRRTRKRLACWPSRSLSSVASLLRSHPHRLRILECRPTQDQQITLNLVPCVTGVYREDAMYFKVLRDGKSCHGGSHAWVLNEWYTSDPPGTWRVGFHGAARAPRLARPGT